MMKLVLLTDRDRMTVTKLFTDVFTKEPWNDDWSDREQLDAYISDLIGQQNSLTLGFINGNQLVGLSMGHVRHWYTGTEYCIDEFCIDRQFQHKGIGSLFLTAIEAFLSENGISCIFLQTEKTMPAYEFYRKAGFQEQTEHISFIKKICRPENSGTA